MSDVLDDIPTLADVIDKPPQFPVEIDPFNSEWWLRPDQQAVCDLYLSDCRFDQHCAYTAGREFKTKNSAHAATTRFFKQAKVRRYLYLRTKKLAKKVELTQEMILMDLIEVKDMALGKKARHMVLGVDKNGFPISDFTKSTDLKAANTALTQLGKYHKLSMWTEKIDTEVSVVNFNFNMGAPDNKTEKLVKGQVFENEK